MPATDVDVLVVGAGPVGLMLAGELRLAGVSVVVAERLAVPMTESRAAQLNTRSAELLAERELAGLLAEAEPEPRSHFGGISFELPRVDSEFAGNWKVPQYRTEQALARRATGLGAEVERGHELRTLDDTGEDAVVSLETPDGPRRMRARFVVGCDGEESTVRRLAGFSFPGAEADRELFRADVLGLDLRDRRFERLEHGFAVANTRQGVTRLMVHAFGKPPARRTGVPQFGEVADLWAEVTGEDVRHGTAVWIDVFGNTRGQAAEYRRGRVLLAGDAAHRHLPIGGQALNIGIQDAVNLGWKLGATVRGDAPAGLLDTYHGERHPVGARVLDAVVAQEDLLLGGPEVEPVRAVLAELLAMPGAQDHLAGLTSGLDVRYGEDPDPLVGRRLFRPGVFLPGQGLLLGPDREPGTLPGREWVRTEPGPEPMLLRPDGHVAWHGGDTPLEAALCRWFGEPAHVPHRPDEETRTS